ncbi:hypothetical protein GR11A_00221 [Vibrio phage vB_VcorM_GR11A]|nr:hypothetical protein GR11A_00221 [Vibrio phage vB_VcorM_GR11A]
MAEHKWHNHFKDDSTVLHIQATKHDRLFSHRNNRGHHIKSESNTVGNAEVGDYFKANIKGFISGHNYLIIDKVAQDKFNIDLTVMRVPSIWVDSDLHQSAIKHLDEDYRATPHIRGRLFGCSEFRFNSTIETKFRSWCTCAGCGGSIAPYTKRLALGIISPSKNFQYSTTPKDRIGYVNSSRPDSMRVYLHASLNDCDCGTTLARQAVCNPDGSRILNCLQLQSD